MNRHRVTLLLLVLASQPAVLFGQATQAEYERALGWRERVDGLALNLPDRHAWIGETSRFWYRKSVEGGFEFNVVDAAALEKRPAFDHAKLAAGLAAALEEEVTPRKLPFSSIEFAKDEGSVEIEVGDWQYVCDLSAYSCERAGPSNRRGRRRGFSMWERGPAPQAASPDAKTSPDGNWEAWIKNYNVYIRSKDGGDESRLSSDGSEGNYYTYASLSWSPDSEKLAAYRLRRGYHRVIQYVESSPADQLQPKFHKMEYAKPGDALDVDQPVLFILENRTQVTVSNGLFPNPYDISNPVWRKDSRAFTFEYNQRGHQVYRIIEVDAATGSARALISEEAQTFFHYSGKKYRHDLGDGKEILWMSERDGWNHIYLYDGETGAVKNQVTRGEWVVRGVDRVDEEKRLVYFRASGINRAQDPYFVHYYQINLDGSDLTPLTEGNYNHLVALSPDSSYFIDIASRVDAPPVMSIYRTSDRKLLLEVESTDIRRLSDAGWRAPEVFVAKGRDGLTDIWGIITRPLNFDPNKKYPVVEYIYAGPHGSFVPKGFSAYNRLQPLAEMGFIVVQIDGMGTNNRSKAFHDVCWKDLGDAGFPDRILWHQAVAERYPYYDIERVGIHGNSAGGQNALGALLFHPDFYDVSVSSCGCHDNRMDKIWWNEQWMGWPLGPEYAASSNVDNAHRLQGKLLLILGEMDTNVDPASTMQVVDALIEADKTFDLLVIPGGGHGMGGAYGTRKLYDFFVQHLHGISPPDWNKSTEQKQ